MGSAMDGVISPKTAGLIGKLGGLGVLNLEGIFSRYEDAEERLDQIAAAPPETATAEMQKIYQEPVKPELMARRIREIKEHGVVAAEGARVLRGRARSRPRHPRHPGHRDLGRARLDYL